MGVFPRICIRRGVDPFGIQGALEAPVGRFGVDVGSAAALAPDGSQQRNEGDATQTGAKHRPTIPERLATEAKALLGKSAPRRTL
jgi:hypothetical protein